MKVSMQKILAAIFFIATGQSISAQNIGIGTSNPLVKLQVQGGLSIKTPTLKSAATPAAGQTHTMVNAVTHNFLMTDSVGRIYDPGGPGGNYLPNLSSGVYIPIQNGAGTYLEITIENISLGTGDSLIIYDGQEDDPVLYKAGNGFNGSNIVVTNFNTYGAHVTFKSNSDAATGSGFSLLFRKVYVNAAVADPPAQLSGSYLNYYPLDAALRSGFLSGAEIGKYSTAFGDQTAATGQGSFAAGVKTLANSYASVAMGSGSESSGAYSIAMGFNAKATGLYTTAIGPFATAAGEASVSAGRYTEANGHNSFAMGNGADASGNYSLATGFATVASGNISSAFGFNTLSKSYASLAIGRYNDTVATESETTWLATDRAFVIGDGTAQISRSNCFYILKNGNGWMQGTLTQASDARLKKDILPLQQVMPKLLSLTGYNYYWKDEQNMPGLQAGLIAQEVQQHMPEIVTSNTEGELAVNYSGMIPYLLQGIKEQQQEIISLKAELKAMKEMISKKYQRKKNDR